MFRFLSYIFLFFQVPVFNKKEEVFINLCEYQIPMTRAMWLLKMSSAYNAAMSESKIRTKRQLNDPSNGKK